MNKSDQSLPEQPGNMSKEELIQQYIEGRLDDQGAEELLVLLDNDPSLLDSVCEDVAFDVRLQSYWKQYAERQKALDDLAIRAAEMEDAKNIARQSEKKPMDNRSRPRNQMATVPTSNRFRYSTGLKALVAVSVFALFVFQAYREFVPVKNQELPAEIELAPLNLTGKITSIADPVFALENPVFKPGQLLENDRIRLESGWVELELINKARIVLEGPVDFQINSSMKLLCNSGRLSAFIPPEATRLEVATPQMVVRDIGTEFVVDVTETDSSVHVVRGKVDVNWFNADWRSFETGEALKIDADYKPLRFSAVFDLFITSLAMKRKESAYRQKKQERRDRLQQKWTHDDSLLYRLNPDEVAENQFGSRLFDGPIDGMKSIALSRKSGRKTASIPVSIDAKPRSLTLVSTFQIETLRRGCNALFMGRDRSVSDSSSVKNGLQGNKVYWQLSGRGTVQLMIGKDGSDVPDEYESPPVFSKKNLKTWTCLATTIDAEAQMITFYKDGQCVVSLPMKNVPEIDLTGMDIGNWQRRVASKTDVRFEGRIAEFYVFDRSLSIEEIRDLTMP